MKRKHGNSAVNCHVSVKQDLKNSESYLTMNFKKKKEKKTAFKNNIHPDFKSNFLKHFLQKKKIIFYKKFNARKKMLTNTCNNAYLEE